MARPRKEKPNRSNGLYEVKVTVCHTFDGKPIRKSFYSSISKADAKAKAQEYIVNQEISARTGEIIAPENITFDKWAYKWLEVYKKPTVSANSYEYTYLNAVKNHIVPYFGKCRLTDIKPADIQHFYAVKAQELSESMMHKLDLCVNGIFETAIDNDYCFKNPAKHTTYTSNVPPAEKRVYTEDQISTVKEFFIHDDFPAAYVILETGLRRGEFLGLMWTDFNFDDKTISVNRSIARAKGGVEIRPPKWDSYRTIPISSELCEFISNQPRTGLYIFGDNGNIRSIDSFNSRYSTAMKRMHAQHPDIPMLTAHELRHTRGTHLRRMGVDIYTIQKIMGHKDINITANTYVHEETEITRKAAKIM